jgi:GT2 family glycosyltransferase
MIIIVSHNGAVWICDCIRSILANRYAPCEILVVDNASHDTTLSLIKNSFPEVTILPQRKNRGFGRGSNIGLEYALSHGADYILLLNQDIRLEHDCLYNMIASCEANDHISIASPVQMNYEGTDVDPRFRRLYGMITDLFRMTDLPVSDSIEVETVIGASMLFRASALREIGGFDPIFFLYHEESDLCRRARYLGHQVHIIRRAIAYHHHVQLFTKEMRIRSKFSSLYGYYIFILKDPFQPFSENVKHCLREMRRWPSHDGELFTFLRRWLINLAAIVTIAAYLTRIVKRRKAETEAKNLGKDLSSLLSRPPGSSN